MAHITVESLRRDGKYMVRYEYPGAPNAFGGHYPARIFRKLYTTPQLIETLAARSEGTTVHYSVALQHRDAVEQRRADLKGWVLVNGIAYPRAEEQAQTYEGIPHNDDPLPQGA
jgi:hypothetical protein